MRFVRKSAKTISLRSIFADFLTKIAKRWVFIKTAYPKLALNIDDKDIRKHKNDIIRLYQLLALPSRIALPEIIKQDMQHFLDHLQNDNSIDMRRLGLKHTSFQELLGHLRQVYGLSP